MYDRQCCLCKQMLPATTEFFHPSSVDRSGLHAMCKPCRAAYNREWSAQHKDLHNALRRRANARRTAAYLRASRDKIRAQVFAAYCHGLICCQQCGETERMFLVIDHINGGGHKHRLAIRSSIYYWLKKHKYPSGYQVLCQNCNFVKAYDHPRAGKWVSQRIWTRRTKEAAIAHYSGGDNRCGCCGESRLMALTIDHINGVLPEHRGKRHRGGERLYLWLRQQRWPEGFQVLCANCNCTKGFYGQCPHKN